MKVGKVLILLLVVTFADLISAGGDNPCDLLLTQSPLLVTFQKLNGVFKFFNNTAQEQLNGALMEPNFSLNKTINDTKVIVDQATAVFEDADLTITFDSVIELWHHSPPLFLSFFQQKTKNSPKLIWSSVKE